MDRVLARKAETISKKVSSRPHVGYRKKKITPRRHAQADRIQIIGERESVHPRTHRVRG